jgi:excisionase family DNA binding protein
VPPWRQAAICGQRAFEAQHRNARLLSVIETARELGISRSLVYELLAAGALRSAKIGRRRLIPRKAVEEFIAGLAPQVRSA